MKKPLKVFLSVFISLTSAIALTLVVMDMYVSSEQSSSFNRESFISRSYSQEGIRMFSSAGFSKDYCLRRWEDDIRIFVEGAGPADSLYLKYIDDIIDIISPVIHPVRISRVSDNPNLHIYLKANPSLVNDGSSGYALINRGFSAITYAEIYIEKKNIHTIQREICVALGMNNTAFNSPELKRNIKSRSEAGEEIISPIEIEIMKMIYSEDFKTGLRKRHFMRLMYDRERDGNKEHVCSSGE